MCVGGGGGGGGRERDSVGGGKRELQWREWICPCN